MMKGMMCSVVAMVMMIDDSTAEQSKEGVCACK